MLGALCPMVGVEGTDWMMEMQLRHGVKVRVVVLAQQDRNDVCVLQERRGGRVRLMAHNVVACFVYACY